MSTSEKLGLFRCQQFLPNSLQVAGESVAGMICGPSELGWETTDVFMVPAEGGNVNSEGIHMKGQCHGGFPYERGA